MYTVTDRTLIVQLEPQLLNVIDDFLEASLNFIAKLNFKKMAKLQKEVLN